MNDITCALATPLLFASALRPERARARFVKGGLTRFPTITHENLNRWIQGMVILFTKQISRRQSSPNQLYTATFSEKLTQPNDFKGSFVTTSTCTRVSPRFLQTGLELQRAGEKGRPSLFEGLNYLSQGEVSEEK